MTPDVLVGQVVAGKYRIDSVIGEGGMGYVVVAYHLQLDTKVAIKLLRAELVTSAEAVERFAREARAAVRITSPHVARVFDVGTLESGAPYMVMEFLEGGDLSSLIQKRGPLPIPEAVDYVLQACEAIAEAHAAGIVHRDLKPANLFCARRPDGTVTIKVLDFGISKLTGGAGAGALNATKTTAIMGSPFYMSPEQMESTRGVDIRTDIWGLGIILYELVTGRTPFEGQTMPEVCLRIATHQPPPLRSLRMDAPAALELVILRCLEKDRDKRYGSVARLAVALRDFASSRGKQTVDTIMRGLEASGQPMVSGVPPAGQAITEAAPPPGAGGGTATPFTANAIDPLGKAQIPMLAGKGKTLAVALAAGAVVVIGIFALRGAQSQSAAPAASTLVQSATPAAPNPVAAPVPAATAVAPPAASETPPAASAAAAPSALSAAPAPAAANAANAAKKAPVAPRAPTPTPPNVKPKTNCDPNFYLDAQGEKHFKPECFH